jgi:hypothetical protein
LPGLLDGGVVFRAYGQVTTTVGGVYRTDAGSRELVFGADWADPETGEAGRGLRRYSAGGERIALEVDLVSQPAFGSIYIQEADREFRVVAKPGMSIGAELVGRAAISWGSLDHDRLALELVGPSGAAIWIADLAPAGSVEEIPALSGRWAGVLVLTLALLALRRLRLR